MKKTFLAAAFLFASLTASAQYYISAAGGYSIASAGVKFGEEINANGTVSNSYGSYGEGLHTQLRGGYFFNDTFGVELGLGYLHGADQTILKNPTGTDIAARGRAYGASASLIYKFTNNIYGRVGFLTKVGGKTEVVGKSSIAGIPAQLINPAAPAGATVDMNMEFTRDFKGRFPLGAIAAIGYKYDLSKSVAIFAELEYMGISVTRDKSTLGDFSATIAGSSASKEQVLAILGGVYNSTANAPLNDIAAANTRRSTGTLLALLNDEITYVDELTGAEMQEALTNPLARKQLSQKVPYSSFGINFGITYTFGSNSKKSAKK